MFGAVGFDAAGRWRPPPQDRRPSSSAPVADVVVINDNIDIDDEGRRRREDDVVIGVCRDDEVHDDDGDLGGENTIGDGGMLSSVGGETIDDDEFTTFTNIVYGVVSPRLAVAGGGGCDDRHHHGGMEEDPRHDPPPRHRHHPRQGYKGAGAAAPVVAPSTGGAGQSDDSRDGTTTGTRTSCDSYYQMQRNGPYITGTYMRQDEVIRNAESWNDTHQRVDLDDVDDDLRRRHSSVAGDYPRDAMNGIMGDFCGGKVECGHVAIGGGGGEDGSSSVGNSTLSSLTHEAWLPRFDVRGRFLSYYVHKSLTATTTKTESSPRTLSSPRTKSSKAGGRQPSIDTPVSEGVRSPATEFMGDVILGSGGGASPPPWHSAPRVRHVDDRNAPPPPIGGGIARPAPLRLTDRMTTGGHVPLDDADVVAASSRPPAEVILVKSTVKGLDICFANDGTNSVSHQLTPSSGSDGDLSHLIVSELRRRHMPGIRRSYADDDKPRYRWDCRAGTGGGGGGRAVLCLLAALSLIGIVVGGVLGGRGAGSSRGSTPGYDVVVWGPDTQGACCVNGDVAKPEGMFGPGGLLAPPGEEEGGGEAPAPAAPLAGSGIFDAPNGGGGGGGGGGDSDADPIDLAPLGSGAFDGIVAGATTAPPTRGPTGAEASPGGGGGEPSPKTRSPTFGPSKGPPTTTTRDPTAGDEPASTSPMAPTTSPPSTTNPTQESSSSIVPSAPRPAPTIPTSGPEAASPSASPTARVTPTTTTSPNPAGMPATASPSSSPSTAPTTTSPTAGVTSSQSASPTTAPTTTSQNTESPVTESPTLSPYELPTTTVTLEPTEKPTELEFLGECPDEVKDGVNYQAEEMVSYRTSPMWKVYECLDGACVAEELPPEGPTGAWILLGLCAPTNDQLNGTDDDTPQVNITKDHLDGDNNPEGLAKYHFVFIALPRAFHPQI